MLKAILEVNLGPYCVKCGRRTNELYDSGRCRDCAVVMVVSPSDASSKTRALAEAVNRSLDRDAMKLLRVKDWPKAPK